jgi:cytoskeletal protein CcmA (bactofilin family)
VTARKRLLVARSGSLTGDVRVARLVIQDGASFSGNVSMGPQAAQATPAAPADNAHVLEAAPDVKAAPSSDGKQKPAPGKGKPKR